MEVKEIQKLKKEVVTDILCDCCGKSCMVSETIIDNEFRIDHGEKFRSFECMKLTARWGYDSEKDMEKWEAFICEKCVDEKFGFIDFNKTKLSFSTHITDSDRTV